MRQSTQKNLYDCRKSTTTAGKEREGGGIRSYLDYGIKNELKDGKKLRGTNSQLCVNLNILDHQLKSAETGSKHGKYNNIYAEIAKYKCTICGTNLNLKANRGKLVVLNCYLINTITYFLVWNTTTQMFPRSENQYGDKLTKLR